jgi:carboxymethylenebutenolidase
VPDLQLVAPDGGKFTGYLALPKKTPAPGVLVIQEIFGVNAVMRAICDDLAAQGHAALCPDIFWRQQPGIQITDKTDAEWQRAFELYKGFDPDLGIGDLKASLAALRSHAACTGKVGTVGYCLGGFLTYMMAVRSDADANVSFYGVGIEGKLSDAKSIAKPLLMHIAEKDQFVPAAAQSAIKSSLAGHRQVTIHVYAGQDHAFARVGGKHYHKPSADQANARTTAFFKQHLS